MTVTEDEVVEHVGNFEFTIERGADTPETRLKWDRRVETLTALLLAAWRREHGEAN